MKKVISILLLSLLSVSVRAQIQGAIIEKETGLPVPFASVTYQSGKLAKVVIANKQGKFSIDDPEVQAFNITCLSYAPKAVAIPSGFSGSLTIELEEQSVSLNEVLITLKNNPAHRIIRRAIENKDRNNFEKYDEYTYRCYLKSVYDISVLTEKQVEEDSLGYVTETVSLCSKQGERSEEKIIANRTSGLESPIFGQVMYSLFYKAISFYNSSIPIFGDNQPIDRMSNEYVTPLSDRSISIYNFILENEYVQENETDTIFEITYYPKKNKNFNGLMGSLFISSDGYALTSIVAQPYEKKGTDFRFKQEYLKVDGKWFPGNLEESVRLGKIPFPIEKGMSVRLGFSLVSNISDVQYKVNHKLPNRIEKLYLDEESIEKNKSLFDQLRPVPMTSREIALYNETDSLWKEIKKEGLDFDSFLNLLTKLPEYKIPVGKIDFDLARLISDNKYEGSRIGLGLYTNERWLKWLSVGGYFGYGTQDKKWKYGGEIEWIIQKSHELKIKYLYQNTLKEAGMNLSSSSYEWTSNYWRSTIAGRFDRVEEHKFEANYQPFRSLQLQLAVSAKDMTPLYGYAYQNASLSKYPADDVRFSLRYAVHEKYGTLGKQRMVLSTGNPVFNVSYTRGGDWMRKGSPVYNKVEVSMDFMAYSGRIGQSNLLLAGGYIDRNVPYGLLFTGEGSRNSWISLLINHTFQTMLPYEFLSDQYVHAFYKHNFGALLFKTKHFSPEFLIAYNAGWGNLNQPSDHAIDFKVQNRIYQEGGVIINNLVKLPLFDFATFNMGIGGFYRHGYYRLPGWKDNLATKITFSLTF